MNLPTFDDVTAARERISLHIHRTPVLTSRYLDGLTGASLFFKCENFQKAGAFKARGATNAVFGLSDDEAENGVVTHSSGNHAGALSYAAARRSIACHVVMPHTAPEVKKNAVKSYGGLITECEPTTSSREAAVERVQAATGADLVHPFDDRRVIAGQATCALELLEQMEKDFGGLPDIVVAPIGGGGLVSGTCLALSSVAPSVQVIAAEPAQADDAARSLKAGHLISEDGAQTIADGLKTSLKPLTWHFVSRHVADIFTASEAEIVAAMELTWQRMKIVIEPSCAVPLAIIAKNAAVFRGKRVGVILTGGNVDLRRLPFMTG